MQLPQPPLVSASVGSRHDDWFGINCTNSSAILRILSQAASAERALTLSRSRSRARTKTCSNIQYLHALSLHTMPSSGLVFRSHTRVARARRDQHIRPSALLTIGRGYPPFGTSATVYWDSEVGKARVTWWHIINVECIRFRRRCCRSI